MNGLTDCQADNRQAGRQNYKVANLCVLAQSKIEFSFPQPNLQVSFSPPFLYISTFASPRYHLFPPIHQTQIFQEDQRKQLTLIYIRMTHKMLEGF